MRRALLLASLLALAACGEGPPSKLDARPLPPPQLVVVNKCPAETPPFQALHLHTAVDGYRDPKNKNYLIQPLKVEESTLVLPLVAGHYYVTVIREKLDTTLIAMTTKTPLELVSGVYELWVFQQSFRLWPPKTPIADLSPPREAGHDLRLGIDLGRVDAGAPDSPRSDRDPDTPRDGGVDAPRD